KPADVRPRHTLLGGKAIELRRLRGLKVDVRGPHTPHTPVVCGGPAAGRGTCRRPNAGGVQGLADVERSCFYGTRVQGSGDSRARAERGTAPGERRRAQRADDRDVGRPAVDVEEWVVRALPLQGPAPGRHSGL